MKKIFIPALLVIIIIMTGCSIKEPNRLVYDFNPKLREVAKPVNKLTQTDAKNLNDMKELLTEDYPGAAGLAANQIGVTRRYIVVRDFETKKLIEMINPMIVKSEGSQKQVVGCLSIPGIYGIVNHAKSIEVKYQDRDLKERVLKADDFLAVAIQHEIDHLNGVLFYDIASDIFYKEE